MPLNNDHRLSVLSDILRSHQRDCCGTISEYEQAGRLVRLLMNDTTLPEEIQTTLGDIEQYSARGARHNWPEQHILEHQTFFDEWLQVLGQHPGSQ